MIKVGIIGGGGYTAGELIRILWTHPSVNLEFVYSNSQAGKLLKEVHEDLLFTGDMKFSSDVYHVDVLFLCQGHGKAIQFFRDHDIGDDIIVIDLGNDFRLQSPTSEGWIYGLPELNRESIKKSKRIANCGCFATAIQMGLLPLANLNALEGDVHISAITGSTGAGQSLKPTTHFTWRNNNISAYKVFTHQHEGEIYQSLKQLQQNFTGKLWFVPYRGNFTRGILATLYTHCSLEEEELIEAFTSYYSDHPFVHLTPSSISLKSVVNTNYCNIHVSKYDGMAIIESAIDNLGKGASGQAVQNMNLTLGLDEMTGLLLKSNAY